jgi:Family of unknown function (DUF6152)
VFGVLIVVLCPDRVSAFHDFPGNIVMRKIIVLFFLATVTLASCRYALADPVSIDPNLSAECRAAMDMAASSSRSESLYKSLIENGAAIEASEKKYFDRFDADKTITLTGMVNEFQWRNPHARIVLTVNNEQGQADQQWVIEMNAAAALARLGWRPKGGLAGSFGFGASVSILLVHQRFPGRRLAATRPIVSQLAECVQWIWIYLSAVEF